MYRNFVKFFLFLLPAETAHHLGLTALRYLGCLHRIGFWRTGSWAQHPRLMRETPFGTVPSPIGLAAGFDKNAVALWGWQALGFGFIEIGTVTPEPQDGNPKPRLFRFPRQQGIINKMGFNNDGAKIIAARLRREKLRGLKVKVGANIGKNKNTAAEFAANDYRLGARTFRDIADYIVINVSSPNTPGLRDLQSEKNLDEIVGAVRDEAPDVALFIKVAPDNFERFSDGVRSIANKFRVSGIICGNTLANHASASLFGDREIAGLPTGGLSGKPVFEKNIQLCEAYAVKGNYVIGVGGIFNHLDAVRYFQAGAKLIQVYSGLVYEGPLFVKKLLKGLIQTSIERGTMSDAAVTQSKI
jgi:dihydroorotate dehydrogenase